MIETDTVTAEVWQDGAISEVEDHGHFRLTPPLPDPETLKGRLSDEIEIITLVPYGCTKLRITIFPQG